MGRKRKEEKESEKIIYTNFLDKLIEVVNSYSKKIVDQEFRDEKDLKRVLLYFPYVPNEKKNPELYIVVKKENNFYFLVSKATPTSIQLFIVHKMHVSVNKNHYEVNPYFMKEINSFKSPIIAIECPDSITSELGGFKKILLKDPFLSKIVSTDFEYKK